MKRIALIVLLVLGWEVTVCMAGVETIGGAAVSYNAIGPDHDAGSNWNTYYYAGAKLFSPDSGSSVWGVVHQFSVNDANLSGWGAKGVLSSRISNTDFFLLAGLGFVGKVAQNADGSLDPGFFADFAALWDASSMIDIAIGGQAVDRGGSFSLGIHASFVVSNVGSLVPKG